MALFKGLSQTDYQEVLRVIGRLLDAEGLCDLRLVEHEDGMTIQARHAADLRRGFETRRLADEALIALLRDAYARVGTGSLRAPNTVGHAGRRYEVVLRAIGRLLDAEGLRNVRLVERADGVTVQVRQAGERRGFETYRLSDADLEALLHDTLTRHGTGELGPRPRAARPGHPPPLPTRPSQAPPQEPRA